jgi:hypothetical protein
MNKIDIKDILPKDIIMPTATFNLRILPKRMLSKNEAAHHCGRGVTRFEIECPVSPVQFPNGDRRWDVQDLDQWLDTLKINPNGADDIIDRLA